MNAWKVKRSAAGGVTIYKDGEVYAKPALVSDVPHAVELYERMDNDAAKGFRFWEVLAAYYRAGTPTEFEYTTEGEA